MVNFIFFLIHYIVEDTSDYFIILDRFYSLPNSTCDSLDFLRNRVG